MLTKKLVLAVVTVAGIATMTACTEADRSAVTMPPGEYETQTHSVDANGTAYDTTKTTTVTKDSNGNKNATVKTETSKDPKGLFNKSTSSSTQTSKTY